MWTPRRIVLLSGCFVAFVAAYLGYACSAVGGIDGLPPLPEAYWPEPGPAVELPAVNRGPSRLADKLKLAFGADCKEQKWPIRLDLHSRNMVLAAEQFTVQEGRVCLTPISIAVFGKDKGDRQPVEINTIRGAVAFIQFDRPVNSFSEIATRKIAEAELSGRIELVNNRRRPPDRRDEDLRVHIPIGPLYYNEKARRIWTHDNVVLTDHKSKPQPHEVKGKGMEMELLTEAPAPKPGQRKPHKETIAGVKWVELKSGVVMDLYTEGKNALFSAPGEQPPPVAGRVQTATVTVAARAPQSKPAERAHLHITTPGKFRYELHPDHDLATFDVPGGRTGQPPQVEVIREDLTQLKRDQLICHHLTLRLRRRESKDGAKKAAEPGSPESVDIETVHAVATNKAVTLTSDAEKLTAQCDDLFHDAIRKRTVLKGKTGVEVIRDGSTMHAEEVCLQEQTPPAVPGQPAAKPYQHVEAKGQGRLTMIDRKEKKTLHAHWQKLLTLTRDRGEDVLTLVGKARFIDEQTAQTLQGDTLKVWLEEVQGKKAQPADGATASRRPRHLEATGNVSARSAEFNINDTGQLKVRFKDAPAAALPADAARPPVAVDRRPVATPAPAPPAPPPARTMPKGPEQPGGKTVARPGPVLTGPAQPPPPARPFDLSARRVEATVLRGANKNTIDELICDGAVTVRQDPARAEEKGTDITGDWLRATAGPDGGYHLRVTGDLAQLQTDRISIFGPEVNIDQSSNTAWVNGDGAMKMESATNFQGEKLQKPVPLVVHWAKSMYFDGVSAEFEGNIQAVQEKGRLACQHLQVYFDRTVSLKQGNKSAEPAKVKHLVCSKEVRIEDHVYQGDRLVKYQRLQGPAVEMRSLEPDGAPRPAAGGKANRGSQVFGYGPGDVRIWEPGEDPVPAAPPAGRSTSARAAAPQPPGMKMTYVAYQNRMNADSEQNTADFWGDVRVLNFPCGRHDVAIDLDVILADDLPEKAVYMRCDRLRVLDTQVAGRSNKEMRALGKVYVQGREFHARADEVTYNQAKEQVIFHGKDGGLATLYKVEVKGGKRQVIHALKIIYHRATGKVEGHGIREVGGN